MFKCGFCNKVFGFKAGITNHYVRVENTQFKTDLELYQELMYIIYGKDLIIDLIQKYKNEQLCVDDLRKLGVNCVRYLELLGIKRTSKEEHATKRYKTKYLETIQTKYGGNVTNVSHVLEIQKKKEKTCIDKHGTYENYLIEQRKHMLAGFVEYSKDENRLNNTVKKIEDTCFNRYGHKNFGQGEEAKRKRLQTRKLLIDKWTYEERLARTDKARSSITYESSIEIKVQRTLEYLQIDYRKHVHKWHRNYDLLILNNILIEVQGDFWHANPSKYKSTDLLNHYGTQMLASDIWEIDRKKKQLALENNFKIIYFWEDEINKCNDEELTQLVKERIYNNV